MIRRATLLPLPIASLVLLFFAGASVDAMQAFVLQCLAITAALVDIHRGGLFQRLVPPSLGIRLWPFPKGVGERFALGLVFLLIAALLTAQFFTFRTLAEGNRRPRHPVHEAKATDRGVLYSGGPSGVRFRTNDGRYLQISCPLSPFVGKSLNGDYCIPDIVANLDRKAVIVRGPLQKGGALVHLATVYDIEVDGQSIIDQRLVKNREAQWLAEPVRQAWQAIMLAPLIVLIFAALLPARSARP